MRLIAINRFDSPTLNTTVLMCLELILHRHHH